MSCIRLYLIVLCITLSILNTRAQGVNNIRILPAEPTSADTISIISDFSYAGACAFGLVYSYTTIADTLIQIYPTYCGYFVPDSVLCNSIDTFRIAPLPAGTYRLQLEYHQGSICPISDFDATLAEFDTSFMISGTNSVSLSTRSRPQIKVYPNPADAHTYVQVEHLSTFAPLHLLVLNNLGQVVIEDVLTADRTKLNTSALNGVYDLCIYDDRDQIFYAQKLLIQ